MKKQQPLLGKAKLTDEQLYAKLSKPLPLEALKPIPGTDRHSINDAYVHERLNKIFGVSGWSASYEVISCNRPNEDMASWETTTKCTLTIPAYSIVREQFGGSWNADKGDSLKGAATDAFGKCASQLGIGHEVYAGLVQLQDMPEHDSYTKPVAGIQQSTKTKYVFHSGMKGEHSRDDWRWLRIGTILCHIGNSMSESDVEQIVSSPQVQDVEIAAHGFWEYAKRGRYLELTNLVECRIFGPVEIPEMKTVKSAKPEPAAEEVEA